MIPPLPFFRQPLPDAQPTARRSRLGMAGLLLAALAACAWPQAPTQLDQPEAPSALQHQESQSFAHQAVAAAHPLAAEAGAQVLREGGNAMDAAVAVQMVLALVEPQSSGIGGGAMLMHWDGQAVQAWDGRETAPAAATPDLFLRPDGQPMPLGQAIVGGRAVGVPGAVRMLEAAHRAHGHLPWPRLLAPAIRLAEDGFAIGPRLHALLQGADGLRADAAARSFFFQPPAQPGARLEPWPVGHVLRNPALAEVLRRLAAQGSAALHTGPVAEAVVQKVRSHAGNPGRLSLADLAQYRPVQRAPLCVDWGPQWRVCGFPPPSSGQLTIMQMLGLMDALPPLQAPAGPAREAEQLHRFLEASRLAFADRAAYIADPAFVEPPGGRWERLLDPAYLTARAGLIGPRASSAARAGEPAGTHLAWAPQAGQVEHGTSHVSIVDRDGHAVALTTTIEAGFGSSLLTDGGTGLPGGFLLNNQLTDFAFQPSDAQGRPVANRVEPGKRPRSSMSPTLVFDRRDGRLVMTLGSPGGAAIIPFTARVLLATLQQGLAPQDAIDQPNVVNLNTPLSWLEAGRFDPAVLQALRARGQRIAEEPLTSGLQALRRDDASGHWLGGADPRREGGVAGD